MAFEFKLPEITFPLVLDTIGKQIAEGYRCHMHCHRCARHASVNLVTVAKHKGKTNQVSKWPRES